MYGKAVFIYLFHEINSSYEVTRMDNIASQDIET